MTSIPLPQLPKSPMSDDQFRQLKANLAQVPAIMDMLDRFERTKAYPQEQIDSARKQLLDVKTKTEGVIAAFQDLHPNV